MIYDDDRIIEEQANNTANRVKHFFLSLFCWCALWERKEQKNCIFIDSFATRTHLNFTQKHDTALKSFHNHLTIHSSEASDAVLHIHQCKYKQNDSFFVITIYDIFLRIETYKLWLFLEKISYAVGSEQWLNVNFILIREW